MDEYIKRQAAIDAVTDVYVRTAGYKARERVWETREAIQKLPAAGESMDWISVKDRLPKPETEVLAVPDDVYNNPVDCAVTHWMPLPESPNGVLDDAEKD